MKKLLLIFCFVLASAHTFANKIDDLKTDSDVVHFLNPLNKEFTAYPKPITIPTLISIINYNNCDTLARHWGITNWDKLDFNNDKRTDLLVIVQQYFDLSNWVAIDEGNNKFKLIRLGYSFFDKCELIAPLKLNNQSLIVFHGMNPRENGFSHNARQKPSRRTDTLIFIFDDFVELNPKPTNFKIDSIQFHTGPCYGTCPTFSVTISNLGYAKYNAGNFSKKEGNFKATLKRTYVENLFEMINYLDVKKLKNSYSVNWTDDASCSITVFFADGSTKQISDYGRQGTFGLKALYSKFFALTSSHDWK